MALKIIESCGLEVPKYRPTKLTKSQRKVQQQKIQHHIGKN